MALLELIQKNLDRFNQVTLFFCRHLTIVLMAVITVVVAAGVFWRYVLNDSLSWTEETAKFLMVWLVFTGSPIALKHGGHAAIETLPNRLPGRLKQAMLFTVYTIILILMVVLVYQGWGFALNAKTQMTSTTQISMMVVFISMPISGVVMFFIGLEHLIQAAKGVIDPAQGVQISEEAMVQDSAI